MKWKKPPLLMLLCIIVSVSVTLRPIALAEGENHDYHIPNVQTISQLPELPNGCEAAAAAMLLNWAGVPVSMTALAEALPKGDLPHENEIGAWIGENPQNAFVGDPFGVGYGVYHKPLAQLLDRYLPGKIQDLTGSLFDELLDVVKSGRPVLVWATEQMDFPVLSDMWEDAQGNTIEWYEPEHALILTGWDDNNAYMNDPMTGEREVYNLWEFKTVWEVIGSQALTVTL